MDSIVFCYIEPSYILFLHSIIGSKIEINLVFLSIDVIMLKISAKSIISFNASIFEVTP